MKFVSQEQTGNEIRTTLRDSRGLQIVHILTYIPGAKYFDIHCEFTNGSQETCNLELLESFNLGNVSLFQKDEANDKLRIHRYTAFWSEEGRPMVQSPEELGMEPSWHRGGARNVRFGHRSTKPVTEFFPSVAVEDTEKQVVWAVQLATISPWQMEVFRQTDFINISGGNMDAEFGGLVQPVKPGQTVITNKGIITCVKGSVDQAFNRLTSRPVLEAMYNTPAEDNLPIMYNEYCQTWGAPYADKLLPEIASCKKLPVKYFTLDDGWFTCNGDWASIREDKYPGGFDAFIEEIRKAGMITGLWFEMEHCFNTSKLATEHPEYLLRCHGHIIKRSSRRILDMRKPEVRAYLDNTMCKVIRDYKIGYIKVDYNASFTSADTENGPVQLGALEYTQAVWDYFKHIKALFPELVIEICASGGARLTSEWLRLGDMASFSDVHETLAIPIVAAHALRQIPMCKSQVWATLRTDDTAERLSYTLSAAFLGRFCLSGTLSQLNDAQFALVRQATSFYDYARPFVRDSEISIQQHLDSASWEAPKGWQAAVCKNAGGAMVVAHFFENAQKEITLELPNAPKHIFAPAGTQVRSENGKLILSNIKDFTACVVIC